MSDPIRLINTEWGLHSGERTKNVREPCLAVAIDSRYIRQKHGEPCEADVEYRLAASYGYSPSLQDRTMGELVRSCPPVDAGDIVFGYHVVAIYGNRMTLCTEWVGFEQAPIALLPAHEQDAACQTLLRSRPDSEYRIDQGGLVPDCNREWGEVCHSDKHELDDFMVCPKRTFCDRRALATLIKRLTATFNKGVDEIPSLEKCLFLDYEGLFVRVHLPDKKTVRSFHHPLRLAWRKQASYYWKELDLEQSQQLRGALGYFPTGCPFPYWKQDGLLLWLRF